MSQRTFALVFVLSSTFLSGQSYQGGLRGFVSYSGGGVMGSAKVTLLDEATNVVRTTVTNPSGEYAFTTVDPATYRITVEAPGFKKIEGWPSGITTTRWGLMQMQQIPWVPRPKEHCYSPARTELRQPAAIHPKTSGRLALALPTR